MDLSVCRIPIWWPSYWGKNFRLMSLCLLSNYFQLFSSWWGAFGSESLQKYMTNILTSDNYFLLSKDQIDYYEAFQEETHLLVSCDRSKRVSEDKWEKGREVVRSRWVGGWPAPPRYMAPHSHMIFVKSFTQATFQQIWTFTRRMRTATFLNRKDLIFAIWIPKKWYSPTVLLNYVLSSLNHINFIKN